ncbi:hypothetical protein BaRGS_00003065 [Batillaria attramentaria]|uniref:Secreted protein n=1 Tax=Batillaria attramentaria TaxID=370345 RepID=A0ABD0M396_9CAEN
MFSRSCCISLVLARQRASGDSRSIPDDLPAVCWRERLKEGLFEACNERGSWDEYWLNLFPPDVACTSLTLPALAWVSDTGHPDHFQAGTELKTTAVMCNPLSMDVGDGGLWRA